MKLKPNKACDVKTRERQLAKSETVNAAFYTCRIPNATFSLKHKMIFFYQMNQVLSNESEKKTSLSVSTDNNCRPFFAQRVTEDYNQKIARSKS